MMDYNHYIVRDPKTCGGEPTMRGTRVTLRTVLASLAEGATIDEIRADFPTLTEDAVRAAIAFKAVFVGADGKSTKMSIDKARLAAEGSP